MAGSLRYFGYTDDQARVWAIQLDETAGEEAAFGLGQSVDVSVLDAGRCLAKTSKKTIEPRYVNMQAIDGDGRVVRRSYTVGNVAATAWADPRSVTYTVDGLVFRITALIGEKRYLTPTNDTGLIDGDVDVQVVSS